MEYRGKLGNCIKEGLYTAGEGNNDKDTYFVNKIKQHFFVINVLKTINVLKFMYLNFVDYLSIDIVEIGSKKKIATFPKNNSHG